MPLFMLLILTADNIDVFPAFPPNTLFLTSTLCPWGKSAQIYAKTHLAPIAQLLDRTPDLLRDH